MRDPPRIPSQPAPCGIRYDFNQGARVWLPADEPGTRWRLRLRDLESGNVLYDRADISIAEGADGVVIQSARRWFVRFGIEVWRNGEAVFRHDYDAHNRPVLIRHALAVGDTIAGFSYTARFPHAHGCRLTVEMYDALIPLFAPAYPEITFVPLEGADLGAFYATYKIMLYRNDINHDWSPSHYRYDGLHHYVGMMLGLPMQEAPPRVAITQGGRPIAEPYVCIAVQASAVNKKWLNPTGWDEVVAFLKAHGYRVVCIDRAHGHGVEGFMTYHPAGAEDRIGDIKLTERGRWLRHADFFIGVSSGLAWLAWAVGTKVVLISGLTHPRNEFMTPYRVINFQVCNSCWNDAASPHSGEQLWCPRHQGTERQFECSRAITGTQVINMIRRIPGFPATA